eukprot:3005540-Amphidinium_carterae.1
MNNAKARLCTASPVQNAFTRKLRWFTQLRIHEQKLRLQAPPVNSTFNFVSPYCGNNSRNLFST